MSTEFVSNEEYLERWENSAPTPVPTIAEAKRSKQTWNESLGDGDISPALQAEIDEYAKHTHDSTSNQNKEELARWQEQNAGIAKEYQWVSPSEYADAGARVGTPMHSSEFINRLRKAGVRCWYKTHPHKDKVTLVVQRKSLPPEVVCFVQLGFAPELSIMNFDEHGVPLAEKYRGWRTVLLRLILTSTITEELADKIFGVPKQTPAFNRYNEMLYQFRRAGGRI
jgi:hypothetical protein